MRPDAYQLFPLDLSTAGRKVFQNTVGKVHVHRIEDATGALALSASLRVKVTERDRDWITLGIDNSVRVRQAGDVVFAWDAQPGLRAQVLLVHDESVFDVSSRPPVQLVLGDTGSAIGFGQEDVGTVATEIVPANGVRRSVTIFNYGNTDVFVGDNTVTAADGFPLVPGASYTWTKTTAAIFGIVAAGTEDVRWTTEV